MDKIFSRFFYCSLAFSVSAALAATNDYYADNLAVETLQNTEVNITLSGGHADGQPAPLEILTYPRSGSLSGNAPNLQYLPLPDFSGTDSFSYRSADAGGASATAVVSISVKAMVSFRRISGGGQLTPIEIPQARPLFLGQIYNRTPIGLSSPGSAFDFDFVVSNNHPFEKITLRSPVECEGIDGQILVTLRSARQGPQISQIDAAKAAFLNLRFVPAAFTAQDRRAQSLTTTCKLSFYYTNAPSITLDSDLKVSVALVNPPAPVVTQLQVPAYQNTAFTVDFFALTKNGRHNVDTGTLPDLIDRLNRSFTYGNARLARFRLGTIQKLESRWFDGATHAALEELANVSATNQNNLHLKIFIANSTDGFGGAAFLNQYFGSNRTSALFDRLYLTAEYLNKFDSFSHEVGHIMGLAHTVDPRQSTRTYSVAEPVCGLNTSYTTYLDGSANQDALNNYMNGTVGAYDGRSRTFFSGQYATPMASILACWARVNEAILRNIDIPWSPVYFTPDPTNQILQAAINGRARLSGAGTVDGWTALRQSSARTLEVAFYLRDVASGALNFVGRNVANQNIQPWASNPASRGHAFSFQIPFQFIDGRAKILIAYAITPDGQYWRIAGTENALRIRQVIYGGLSNVLVTGNARGVVVNQRSPLLPTQINFYLGGPRGQGVMVGSTYSLSSAGAQPFSFQIPQEFLRPGVVNRVWAYAVDAVEESEILLSKSPFSFRPR